MAVYLKGQKQNNQKLFSTYPRSPLTNQSIPEDIISFLFLFFSPLNSTFPLLLYSFSLVPHCLTPSPSPSPLYEDRHSTAKTIASKHWLASISGWHPFSSFLRAFLGGRGGVFSVRHCFANHWKVGDARCDACRAAALRACIVVALSLFTCLLPLSSSHLLPPPPKLPNFEKTNQQKRGCGCWMVWRTSRKKH